MKENKADAFDALNHLPITAMPQGVFFVDLQLHEFRAVDDSSHVVSFQSDEGSRMVRTCGITLCPACDGASIVPQCDRENGFYCPRCGAKSPPADGDKPR